MRYVARRFEECGHRVICPVTDMALVRAIDYNVLCRLVLVMSAPDSGVMFC